MISMLTGSNPFYREPRGLQEAYECEVPDFIIERILMEEIEELEEDTTTDTGHEHEGKTYHHVTVSKHIKNDEAYHKVSHAVKDFADHVENHASANIEKHGTRTGAEHDKTEHNLHRHIEKNMGMRSKPSTQNKIKTQMHHTHALGNEAGHAAYDHTKDVKQKETSHSDHVERKKKEKDAFTTADHVIHWHRHPNTGKVHIMGVSRHNSSEPGKERVPHMNNSIKTMRNEKRVHENKNY